MLADFSKILTENFVVSFLMPSVIFILISSVIFLPFILEMDNKINDNSSVSGTDMNNSIKETFLPYKLQILWEDNLGVLSFLSVILSIFLLLLNRPMIRILEGYFLLSIPGTLYFERRRFEKIMKDLTNTQNNMRNLKQKSEDKYSKNEYLKEQEKHAKLGIKLRTQFPFAQEYLLPTRFGNAIRSFETYSYRVYGIDAIVSWSRIINCASESHRKNINDASSRVNFSVNGLYLTATIFFELLVVYSFKEIEQWSFVIYEFFTIIILICLWKYSLMSVKLWGDEVKSVFDLYRYDLMAKLNGLKENISENIPRNEEEYWHVLNKMFLYHNEWESITKKYEMFPKIMVEEKDSRIREIIVKHED